MQEDRNPSTSDGRCGAPAKNLLQPDGQNRTVRRRVVQLDPGPAWDGDVGRCLKLHPLSMAPLKTGIEGGRKIDPRQLIGARDSVKKRRKPFLEAALQAHIRDIRQIAAGAVEFPQEGEASLQIARVGCPRQRVF